MGNEKICPSNPNKEIANLKNQLNEANNKIKIQKSNIDELNKKVKDFDIEIDKYKKIIIKKDEEIQKLKYPNAINPNDIVAVNFTSDDQKVHFALVCNKNDIFAVAEEKLYQQYPEYRETNNSFIANGNQVLRFKSVADNKIDTGFLLKKNIQNLLRKNINIWKNKHFLFIYLNI